MEMIAMLNGLGNAGCRSCGTNTMSIVSGPALGRLGEVVLSEGYKLFFDRIEAAKTEAELTALDAEIASSALPANEKSALRTLVSERASAIGPIYKRWWYWPAVAGVAIVGYHFYKKSKTGRGIF